MVLSSLFDGLSKERDNECWGRGEVGEESSAVSRTRDGLESLRAVALRPFGNAPCVFVDAPLSFPVAPALQAIAVRVSCSSTLRASIARGGRNGRSGRTCHMRVIVRGHPEIFKSSFTLAMTCGAWIGFVM
jgi:hypothetical protein